MEFDDACNGAQCGACLGIGKGVCHRRSGRLKHKRVHIGKRPLVRGQQLAQSCRPRVVAWSARLLALVLARRARVGGVAKTLACCGNNGKLARTPTLTSIT
jgi:hypothetical protein